MFRHHYGPHHDDAVHLGASLSAQSVVRHGHGLVHRRVLRLRVSALIEFAAVNYFTNAELERSKRKTHRCPPVPRSTPVKEYQESLQLNPDSNGNLRKRMNYITHESRVQLRAQSLQPVRRGPSSPSGQQRGAPGSRRSELQLTTCPPQQPQQVRESAERGLVVRAACSGARRSRPPPRPNVMRDTPPLRDTPRSETRPPEATPPPPPPPRSSSCSLHGCSGSSSARRDESRSNALFSAQRRGDRGNQQDRQVRRILFPVSFGAFNMVYWVVYLSKDTMVGQKT
ncbi:hypothetical protein WMY93_008765 [Mugilogobius chulae]|uniref:Uncharacterized protein n=1 Tax=Mugilogobius chulae TaxID=88201 RepID=A0AAW0PD32_9GOBI